MDKYKDFKAHEIIRSSPKAYKTVKEYRRYLEGDFHHRCCYCNYSDQRSMIPFEIDHFIPRAEFKGKNEALNTKYENLMYSCKKCNNAKGAQFKGDVFSPDCSNEFFYDPTKTDYNTVFYRDKSGCIVSDDVKGRDMICRLKLYRGIHVLAWLCEELEEKKEILREKKEQETNTERKQLLTEAYYRILDYYCHFRDVFNESYKNDDLRFAPIQAIMHELIEAQ